MKALKAWPLLLTLVAAPLCADDLSPSAQTRPLLPAAWQGIVQYGSSPARWDRDDLKWLVPSALGAGYFWNNDIALNTQLGKGDARKEWLDQSMPTVSMLGEGWSELLLVLTAYGLGNERLTRTSGAALQSLAVVGVYAEIFKWAAWSNRPTENDQVHRLWAYDQRSKGMPSGHTFSAFALAEVYGAEYGRIAPYTLAAVMGYSRIYNQAHFVSDVWVGAILGIAAGHLAHANSLEKGAPALRWSLQDRDATPVLTAQWTY